MYGQLTTVLFLNPRARRTKLVVRGTGLKFTPPDQTQVHELNVRYLAVTSVRGGAGARHTGATKRRKPLCVKNLSLGPQLRPNLPKNLSLALGALRS